MSKSKAQTNASYDTVWKLASRGELESLKPLLADNPKLIDTPDERGFTPLSWAARNGHLETVNYLTDKLGANTELFSFGGLRPLHHAVNKNHEKVIKALIQGPEELKINNDDTNSTTSISKFAPADLLSLDENGDSVYHYAASRGVLTIMTFLTQELEKKYENNSSQFVKDYMKCNSQGLNPLHKACIHGQLPIVKKICDVIIQYADSNDLSLSNSYPILMKVDQFGFTPLHYASSNGHGNILNYLLDLFSSYGKTILDLKNGEGYTAKEIAFDSNIEKIFNDFKEKYNL